MEALFLNLLKKNRYDKSQTRSFELVRKEELPRESSRSPDNLTIVRSR